MEITPMVELSGTIVKAVTRSDHACFGCGDDNPIGLHLRFSSSANGVSAPFTPEPEHQGFESVVHGGIISTILDEAMAWATAHAGLWAVTGEMRVRFRLPLHVAEPTTVSASVTGVRGNFISTTAVLTRLSDLTEIATASATFVRVSSEVEAVWQARYTLASDMEGGDGQTVPRDHERAQLRQ
jgi:acyl-coenzyme A thioesterase PaaI-like protein